MKIIKGTRLFPFTTGAEAPPTKRQGKYCKCHHCGKVGRCRPNKDQDFYDLNDDPKKLLRCEACFKSLIEQAGGSVLLFHPDDRDPSSGTVH